MVGFEWGIDVSDQPTTNVEWNVGIPGAQVTISPTWGWHTLSVRGIDEAGNLSALKDYSFGWGLGGFSTPQTTLSTQKYVTVQVNTTTSYSGISLRWKPSASSSWTDVTPANVLNTATSAVVAAWPLTSTTGTYDNSSPTLIWDAATTASDVDGPLELQVGFYNGTSYTYLTDTTSIPNITLDQNAFGSGYATASVGPGSVNLLTGNLELSATDVSIAGNAVTRTFQSRAATVTGSIFGPGWTTSIQTGSAPYRQLMDNTSNVVATDPDGGLTAFQKQTGGGYVSPAGHTDFTLTKISSTRFELGYLTSSTVYGFTHSSSMPTGVFMYSDTTDPTGATATTKWTVVSGITRPTQSIAAPPPTVICTSPLTTKGCRTTTYTYATSTAATGLCGGTLGNVAGQLEQVKFTAWDADLTTPAMQTYAVADYCYDITTHLLRTTWDPRISPDLVTTYTYNANGQVATLTPPGEYAWTFAYAPLTGEPTNTGRLSTVARPALPPASGTATTTVVYQIPLTTAAGGPDNLDPTSVAAWGQHDDPTTATAIYPPDQIPSGTLPSSYTRATVYYLNAQQQLVNVRDPGDYISTSEHDRFGNIIRTLTAANRQEALAISGDPTLEAAESSLLDDQSVFDSAGVNLIDSYGPAHEVSLPDGSVINARQHEHAIYDQGSPGGVTFNLVTTQTESATPIDGSADQDIRTTTNTYTLGADNSGWTLHKPLQVTVDPGSTPHLNLTTTTKYNVTTGNMTARILPANPAGGDAHETDFIYYTADTTSGDPACNSHPEYATLLCKTEPAAQPGTAGLPNLATTQITKYDMWDQPEITVDTNGSDSRTTTIGYDLAGRESTQTVTATAAGGTAIPEITTTYDSATGMVYRTTDGTVNTTRSYDHLGRITDYWDADGNHTQYTYDLLNNVLTMNDGKGTTTYTYDTSLDPRGLLTSISDSQAGTFTATYDAEGRVNSQTYPGSNVTAFSAYDEVGNEVVLGYLGAPGTYWPTFSAIYNIHGERTAETGSSFDTFTYTYDAAGRLTQTNENQLFDCIQRNYTLDADSNRTQLSTAIGGGLFNPTPCPPTGTQAVTNSTYDSADRDTDTGYTYDPFGRTTAVPAADSPSGDPTTLSYYTNDLVNTITADSVQLTYYLDPNERVRNWNSSADGLTHTDHYSDDGDSPAWTAENGAGTLWTRYVSGFDGLGATVDQTNTVTLQLADLQGDVFSTVPSTGTDLISSGTWTATDEYGNTEASTGIPVGYRYDYEGTHQRLRDTNSGLQLMGQRVYNSTTGRFLQTDPVLGGSANSYDYANADPVNELDLSGQSSCHACDVLIWIAAVRRNQIAEWDAAVARNHDAMRYATLMVEQCGWCSATQGQDSESTAANDSGPGDSQGQSIGTVCGDPQCGVGGGPNAPPSHLLHNVASIAANAGPNLYELYEAEKSSGLGLFYAAWIGINTVWRAISPVVDDGAMRGYGNHRMY